MKTIGLIAIWFCSSLAPGAEPVDPGTMVRVSGGIYQRPLEKGGKQRVVKAFDLDARQVTNADYLAFVTANPQWRRSRVNRLFADTRYLAHWAGDLELGAGAPSESPVVCVSWHAARAYLKSTGKRLPTVDEWEFAARADQNSPEANQDPAFKAKILAWYAKPTPAILPAAGSDEPNYYGLRSMHGLVWEWTHDFVSAMTSGEARSDGSQDAQLFCGGGGADPGQATEYANFMRIAFRSSLQGDFCLPGLGFRGARDAVLSDSKPPAIVP